MTMYRKLPVVIEARQFKIGPKDYKEGLLITEVEQVEELAIWCGGTLTKYYSHDGKYLVSIRFDTLEGLRYVAWGDYIIKGVKGEFYPCKPDIFKATYEEVKETEAPKKLCTVNQFKTALTWGVVTVSGRIVHRERAPLTPQLNGPRQMGTGWCGDLNGLV